MLNTLAYAIYTNIISLFVTGVFSRKQFSVARKLDERISCVLFF